jgi:oligoribonuclease NrnB/cAMP/cGMP phosphodiesterase (DHH superfamily)
MPVIPFTPDVVFYHGGCTDGWAAAYIAKKTWPDVSLQPMFFGQPTPLEMAADQNVLVVDFSWKHEEMLKLKGVSANIFVLDHHKTAEAELAGLDFCFFDMNRSGARLMWDVTEEWSGSMPWWVPYVEDRDLWRWALPCSREVSAYLMSLPHTEEAWDQISRTMAEAINMGRGILQYVKQYVANVVAQRQMGHWDGLTVAVVNAAYPNISDVGHELTQAPVLAQVGMGWFERGDGLVQFSLRSEGSVDVSALAKKMGGGGHLNAAGFELTVTKARVFLDVVLGR